MKPKRSRGPNRRRNHFRSSHPFRHGPDAGPELKAGDIEYEFGIPIAGAIVPKEQWTQSALKRIPESRPVDWNSVFGREAPLVVDIGCGNGRFTIGSALLRPECNHLAIDSLPTVIRYGTRRANQRGLHGVRFAVADGWRFLTDLCSDASIHEIHIYHPQPYADPVDFGKRMLTPDFLGWMHRRLVVGGKVYLQTDRSPYWTYISCSMSTLFDWTCIADAWGEEPEFRSRREILAMKQGLTIYRGVGIKRESLDSKRLDELIQGLPEPTFSIDSNYE